MTEGPITVDDIRRVQDYLYAAVDPWGSPGYPLDWPWEWILASCMAHLWDAVALWVALDQLDGWQRERLLTPPPHTARS